MSANSKIPEDKHLQSALYGTPKVNPDEQRRYLGTFRERVCLTVGIEELTQDEWTQGFAKEIATEQAEIIFFNGNIDQSKLRPYILTATKSGVNFTIKTNPEYRTNPDNLAIVVASKKAIYVQTVDIAKKYQPDQAGDQSAAPKKKSFWSRLFKS